MTIPTYNVQIEPILKKGSVRLTSREYRIIAGDVLERHLDILAAFLRLGFSLVRQKGPEYRLHHPKKNVSAVLNIDLEALSPASRRLVEGFFKAVASDKKTSSKMVESI